MSRKLGHAGQLVVWAKSPGFAPVSVNGVVLPKKSCPLPMFVRTIVCCGLIVPTCSLLKSSGGLESCTVGAPPCPWSGRSSGPILLENSTAPVTSPTCVGVRLTVTLQVQSCMSVVQVLVLASTYLSVFTQLFETRV